MLLMGKSTTQKILIAKNVKEKNVIEKVFAVEFAESGFIARAMTLESLENVNTALSVIFNGDIVAPNVIISVFSKLSET